MARHIDAFNAHDLDALMACFSTDASWATGADRFQGAAALRMLFAGAFEALSPVEAGRITAAKIYREGSADISG